MADRLSFPQFFQHLAKLGFSPTSVIDVGAADGTPALYEAFPGAPHYAFEPLPSFADKLRYNLRGLNARIYQTGLMDKPGTASLFLHDDPYGSSFMNSAPPKDRDLPISITTLDIALAGEEIGNQALLKTDCQGADLLVMRGGRQTLSQCEVVIMECSLFRFWGDHEPIFDEIVSEMRVYGFAVYDLLDGLRRPFDGALGQVDVAFARIDGGLRLSNQW